MSSTVPPDELVSALRTSLKETERLRKSNRQLLSALREPVAIVGMSCRYPGGVDSPEALWDLAIGRSDAISGLPGDRGWDLERIYDPDPDHPGTSYARDGGFLTDAGDFDAHFFGISPREAPLVDPQQRLLLEVTWEAIEDAGIDASILRGSPTGVFAGSMYQDYGVGMRSAGTALAGGDVRERDLQLMAAATSSAVSGRVAYTLGLEGPAVSIDTACSSSLVAVHLACQSLRSGECSLALAGGVAVLSSPAVLIGFSRQRALAPDGRCKAFAEGADGTSVAEGVAVVALERLADARRHGHRVLGVIRASAVNQDGASNGLTAPNGPAQERVIRQSLASAGLSPSDVDAVEAHGTGTTLGDPIEAQALLATYGQQRPDGQPLWLGSVKSNIGHTQAAAGLAGLIKMVMALRNDKLAPTLHIDMPSTHVDWSGGSVSLLSEEVPWPRRDRPRRAGVSSFGISGTNAHVILEEAPPEGDAGAEPTPIGESPLGGESQAWVLSAKTPAALRAQAERLNEHVSRGAAAKPADIGLSLACTRTVHEHRAVLLGGAQGDLVARLDALAGARSATGLIEGVACASGGVVFVFPGQGAQWGGMAVDLLERSPVFAEAMRACEQALRPYVDWSLENVLRGQSNAPALERVDVVQPVLFAVMVSLAALWRACGVEPAAVVGHSQGEIAAAHVAGGLTLEDAARVIALRSRALLALSGRGGMVSVALELAQAQALLERYASQVSIAAVNGPSSVVLCGDSEALSALLASCEAEGIRAKRLPVDYAAHSRHVEEIRRELLDGCAPIVPRGGQTPFYSAVTGGPVNTAELDGDYWYRNLRETVHFAEATKALLGSGYGAFIEISPHPVLTVPIQETSEQNGQTIAAIGSLRREEGGPERMLASLSEAWVNGVDVSWSAVLDGTNARTVPLPKYAFQRRRYWLDAPAGVGDMLEVGQSSAEHPLLGANVSPAGGDYQLLTGRLSLQSHPWLADHEVMGLVVFPGAGLLELAIHAGTLIGCGVVRELTLEAPLILQEQGAVHIQLVIEEPGEAATRTLAIYSRPESDASGSSLGGQTWVRNASGVLAPGAPESEPSSFPAGQLSDSAWPPADAAPIDTTDIYERLAALGVSYGPAFQGLRAAWRRDREIFAEVSLSAERRPEASSFGVHPAMLDTTLHGLAAKLLEDADSVDSDASVLLPFSCNGLELYASDATSLRVRLESIGEGTVSVSAVTETGVPVLAMQSLALRPVSAAQLSAAGGSSEECVFRMNWVNVPIDLAHRGGEWAVLGGNGTLAQALRNAPRSRDDAQAATVGTPPTAEVQAAESVYEDLAELAEALDTGTAAPELVLSGFGLAPEEVPSGERLIEVAHRAAQAALELVQNWLADPRFEDSRLVVFTHRALSVRMGEDAQGLAYAPIWGLLRSAESEHPGRLVLVDVEDLEECSVGLQAAIAHGESQLVMRAGMPLVARLAPLRSAPILEMPSGVSNWRLTIGAQDTLEGLHLAPCTDSERALAPTEVRVAVRAAGLNFRDVVSTLGLVPTHDGRIVIGSEGAGVVTEVGSAVSDMAPGERVMGIMLGAFAPTVIAERQMIAPMPEQWSFAEAAAVSGAFLTAYYAIHDLARLQPGERLLVHAAAGGVGMAAVQLGYRLGAEVFATASPSKWPALRKLGLDDAHIASSRDLDFKRKFLKETDGHGMDVVLNSLAREFVDSSLELLPQGGRFIEMGKTDIRDAAQIADTYPGVFYRAFDLIEAGEKRSQEMLAQTIEWLCEGSLERLPILAWDIRHAPEAFRYMSQAKHVGKIVLTLPDPPIDPRGSALITGGTGRLGGLVAKHLLLKHGVRRLVLASRRGREAPGAVALEEELLALGAEIVVEACDVADREQLGALINSFGDEHPLRAVVHVAGVLDDGVIQSLNGEQLQRAFAPKVDAAWWLHELTAHLDLDAFLLFSSVSGTIGGPGQANYAAANVFLDTLAARRRAQGLPAVAMAWGGWADASEMTGHLSESDLARVRRAGVQAFSSEQALDAFDRARDCGEALTVPLRLDLARLRARASEGTLPVLLSGLVRAPARSTARQSSGSLERLLEGIATEERPRVALELVRAEVAVVLGYDSPESIDVRRAFQELGFDSLLAVELRNRLNATTGLRLPATLVFDYPTPADLAQYLLAELGNARTPTVVRAARRSELEEPVALVAMGCRYPGSVSTPEDLWELLAAGVDAISAFPGDRGWDLEGLYDPDPDRPGTSYVREGGFLHQLAEFDADFFGISPREALMMDPQQRLLLEVTWETLERAGIAPDSLRGSATGVFAGTTTQDYSSHVLSALDGAEGYLLTGTSASVLSGRVAYTLGLEGPAVTIDTACSSSLVAMHMACAALRSGECSLALAGGVTALCTPLPFLAFSRQRGLAPDGRCKSFADCADGTGVSEGIGLVLLERLSDARRHNHPVLAVVRGSAINQDGASNGLAAPNGPAQQNVILQALANAGLTGDQVDAVEAHGTGTTLGDPIEAQALLATYGRERAVDRPLWLGSIKSNIGHTQAAAGMAGVIKMVMAMRHGVLPKTLHVDRPTEQVDWSQGAVALLTESTSWETDGSPRRAAVSSFGVSGTNAHLILEQATAPQEAASSKEHPRHALPGQEEHAPAGDLPLASVPLVLSGRGLPALRAQAQRMHDFLSARESIDLDEVALALSSRAIHEHRAVVCAEERSELLAGLQALAGGQATPAVLEGAVVGGGERVAFLFTGQGSQRPGMGRELYEQLPRFKAALDEVCSPLEAELDCSLREVMFAPEGSPQAEQLDDTMLAQAALFALEVALFRLLESWHVRPSYLIGHSIGELSAAHVAGVFSLQDACKLVAARGRLMSALPREGMMIAVQASPQEAQDSLAESGGRVVLAAVNGPSSIVLSGEADAVLDLGSAWERRARKVKLLRVSHAFHSPLMEGMLERFGEVAQSVSFNPPRIPIVSNLTGEPAAEELCSPEYWVRHVRETVRFAQGIGWLGRQGVRNFLELGPDAVLSSMTSDCLADTTSVDERHEAALETEAPLAVGLLRATRPELPALLGALAELWIRGAPIDWVAMLSGEVAPQLEVASQLELPTYPFQRQRYWIEGSFGAPSPRADSAAETTKLQPSLDTEERRFWQALESEDVDSLAGVMGIEGEDLRSSLAPVLPSMAAWRRHSREQSTVDGWRYRVEWKPIASPATRRLSGSWLVIVPMLDEQGWATEIAQTLTAAGEQVVQVFIDAATATREGMRRAVGEALEQLPALNTSGVVSLLGLHEQSHQAGVAVPGGLAATVALSQALEDLQVGAPLWLITRSAVSVSASEPLVHPPQAQVWGLGMTLGLERPGRWGGIVDLPDTLDERVRAQLPGVLQEGNAEDQLALRGAGVFARRLTRASSGSLGSTESWSPPAGTTMITGGLGELGAQVGRWLADAGAQHLLLVGRRGSDTPGAQELCAQLRERGAEVTLAACDIADKEQLAGVIGSLPERYPLSMVVHAAGIGVHGALDSLGVAELEQALSAKAQGAHNLDVLTEGLGLKAFVLFSSIAGTLGSGEQGAYAAANAYLDALAVNRRGRGLAASAIAWGAWAGEGMASGEQHGLGDLLRRRGVDPMAPDLALEALREGLAHQEALTVVADIRWDAYAPLFASARRRPLIGDIPEARAALEAAAGPQAEAAGRELRARLAAMPADKRRKAALDLVCVEVARVLGHPSAETVDARRTFKELGFDSLSAVELRNRLGGATGLELAATLVFDYPTPLVVADYLHETLTDGEAGASGLLDGELGRLEQSLVSLEGPVERQEAVALLRDLLDRVEGTYEGSDAEPQLATDIAERLRDASDEELFGFIDQQLHER
jgi:polyketide synthase 12